MTRLIFLHLFLLLSCPPFLAATLNGDGDFQLWFYTVINKKISENAKLTFEPEFRFGDNATTLYNYYFQSRFHVQINPWFDVAGGYRQQFVRPAANAKWRRLYIPFSDVFLMRTLGKVDFDLRNRMEYAIVERGPVLWLYRQRYRFITSVDLGKFTLKPVIWNEFFFGQRRGFFQNRLSVGASVAPGEGLTLTAHYTLRSLKTPQRWISANIIYLWLAYTF